MSIEKDLLKLNDLIDSITEKLQDKSWKTDSSNRRAILGVREELIQTKINVTNQEFLLKVCKLADTL